MLIRFDTKKKKKWNSLSIAIKQHKEVDGL